LSLGSQPLPYCCRKGRVALWDLVEPAAPQAVAEPMSFDRSHRPE